MPLGRCRFNPKMRGASSAANWPPTSSDRRSFGGEAVDHRLELALDLGHNGIGWSVAITVGADRDCLADLDYRSQRTMHANLIGEVLLEPFDGLHHALRQVFFAQNIVARIVRQLLGKI